MGYSKATEIPIVSETMLVIEYPECLSLWVLWSLLGMQSGGPETGKVMGKVQVLLVSFWALVRLPF